MPFQAFRITEYADWRTGAPEEREDITAAVLAMPRDKDLRIVKLGSSRMTARTANDLRAFSRPPREGTHGGRDYDANRALEYCRVMTGREPQHAVWAAAPVHGEKKPRIRAVMLDDGEWPIPHWNWNGHNEQPQETFDVCLDALQRPTSIGRYHPTRQP